MLTITAEVKTLPLSGLQFFQDIAFFLSKPKIFENDLHCSTLSTRMLPAPSKIVPKLLVSEDRCLPNSRNSTKKSPESHYTYIPERNSKNHCDIPNVYHIHTITALLVQICIPSIQRPISTPRASQRTISTSSVTSP